MPPIARAETVGSLLRPAYLMQARQDARDGKISAADLRAVEGRAVLEAIALQKSVGLDVISDAEYRRQGWNPATSFQPDAPIGGYGPADDYRITYMKFWRDDSGQIVPRNLGPGSVIKEPLTLKHDIVTSEYDFLRKNAGFRTKYTFTAPSYHRHFWHPKYSSAAYPTVDIYLKAVRDFIRREIVDRLLSYGCDYIQLDAPNYGQAYTDPEVRAAFEAEGHDLDAEAAADAELDNSLFDGISGVTRAIHVCRGNGGGGYWSATGGYEHFAHLMFPRLTNVDTLLLEYDTERAGGFEPLQHVRPGTTAVLGLLTTKNGKLEDDKAVEDRIREASKFLPLQNLALSTQCGFASSGAGNPLTVEEQNAKLQLVRRVATRIWG
ncbi:MAG TPA: cobalamin-independent methionine synthase II family protein [Dehalococcoidia bacterium]|nr:cobalamin-independent methionine synthase II family protein [Dehalococcoidia bacterium]